MAEPGAYVYRETGFCPICEQETVFSTRNTWLRDHLICERCTSIPRERALMAVVQMRYPNWRDLAIHESSPGARGVSPKMAREAKGYVATQFDDTLARGAFDNARNFRNEDLARQTFADASFDLVITQDVFEHLFRPDLAIREIARTLKSGGAHICTVPIVLRSQPSRRRAALEDGKAVHHLPAEYHGNPISAEGALVTVDWGYDIVDYLAAKSGLNVTMVYIDDIRRGIRADFIEVLVCRKSEPQDI